MGQRTIKLAWIAIGACLIGSISCALRTGFRLLPAEPQYVVQSPDRDSTPYNEVLRSYTPQDRGWIELKPGMGLFLQNVLFREGSKDHTLENYIGTESIRYEIDGSGELAEFGDISRMEPRPRDAPPIDQLISKRQLGKRHHRFFYQVLIRTPELHRVAALVSADSPEQLQSLTERIRSGAPHLEDVSADDYTLFPESSSVAVELSFTVDGAPTRAVWGARLSSVTKGSDHPKLFRFYKGKWRKVDFDPADRTSLSVPLLPKDRIELK